MTTKEVVDATGRDQRMVLTAIGDLRAAGLVAVDGDHYSIDLQHFVTPHAPRLISTSRWTRSSATA